MFSNEKRPLDLLKSWPYLWLIAILIVGFLIRLWLLDKRWIDPDEGAHLMDGRLVLDGLVPQVDYGSRQIVYVYIIAAILKIFGISYTSVRFFLPLISTMGVSIFVFFISKRLFNEKVALLASGIYTFLPLSITASVIVNTEPLTTLLTCIGLYFVISGVGSEKRTGLLFFSSGVFLSLAFYVRESSLAIPVGVFFFFVVTYWGQFQKLFRNYGIVLSGYLFICLIVFTYYSQFMTASQMWHSSINPLNKVLECLQKVFGLIKANTSIAEVNSFRLSHQSWSQKLYYLDLTLITNSFLFAGLLFSLFILIYSLLTKRNNEDFKEISLPFSLLYSWLFSLAAAYYYWTLQRGFFIQYFEEFMAPMAILLAFVIIYSLTKLESQKNLGRNMVLAAIILSVVFTIHRRFPGFYLGNIIYILLTISVLSVFRFFSYLKLRKRLYAFILSVGIVFALVILVQRSHLSPVFVHQLLYFVLFSLFYLVIFTISGLKLKSDLKMFLGFIAFSLLMSSFVLSIAMSGLKMGVTFDSVWSPETVKETSNYLRINSKEDDEVISGAVIWEFESNRKPFMLQSHPAAFKAGMSEERSKEIERGLSEHPPEFIVLDGYTEKTYLKRVDKLQMIINEKYQLKKVIDGSRYPVKIYELGINSKRLLQNEKILPRM